MAWNEPGNNNDKDRDPWKNTGKSQIPPDLEKILRSVWDKLTGTFGGQSPASPGGSTGLVVFALLAIVIWIGSGFYTIEEAEKKYTVLDIRLGKDPVVFGFMNSQWEVLKSKMQKGDKLFLYRSSDYATSRQGGMEKFILNPDLILNR